MKIRRYLANNTQEAILKVKMDLGSDALILNTRRVRQKGIFKIFKKPMVEVLAAIDDDYSKKERTRPVAEIEKPQIVAKEKEVELGQTETKPVDELKICELENKVRNMETLLYKIYDQVRPQEKKQGEVEGKQEETDGKEQQIELPKVFQIFYNNLLKNEVEPEIAKKLIDIAYEKVSPQSSINEVVTALYSEIAGILGKPETIKLREDGKPTVIIFVGPTGVGKTTTLAKIAANYSLNMNRKVGLITADTSSFVKISL